MNEILEAAETRPSFFTRILGRIRFPYRHDPLFSVVFFASVFVPMAMFSYLADGSESPKLFVWLICLGLALVYISRRAVVQWRLSKILTILLGAYVLFTLISTIFSFGPLISVFGWYSRFTSSLLFSSLWVGWIVVLTLSLDRQKIIFLLKALTIVGVAIAVYGIIQQQGIGYYTGITQQVRSLAPSFLGNPNFSSMFLAGILPLTGVCLILAQSRRVKYAYALSLILMVWAIMGFSSRGAIVGVLAGIGVFGVLLFYLKGKLQIMIGLGLFILVTAAFFSTLYIVNRPDAAREVVSFSDQTSSFRWLAWNDAVLIMEEWPWTGTGPGNYLVGFRSLANQALVLSERFDDPHNIFLHIGASIGLPALAAFIGIIMYSVLRGWRTLRKNSDPVIIGLVASLAAVLAGGSFNPVTVAVWLLMAFTIGALAVLSSQEQTVRELAIHSRYKVVGVVVACVLFMYCATFLAADILTYQVITSYNNKNYTRTVRLSQWVKYLNPSLTSPQQYGAAARVRLRLDPETTRKFLKRTVSLNPRSTDLLRRQVVVHFMLYDQTGDEQDKRAAYDTMDKAFELEPLYATNEAVFAYYYFRLEDYSTMITHSRRAVILNPNDFHSWVLLGKYYQLQDAKPQMLFALEKAYALNTETLVFKKFLQAVKEADSVKDIAFPIVFPPIAL